MGTSLSPVRKKELLDELRARGVSLDGNRGRIAEFAINCADAVSNVDDVLSVFQLGFLPMQLGIVGIVLSPISNMIAIVNAKESGYKLFGAKAVAYTTTAWAFDDKPLPPAPPRRNLAEARKWKGPQEERKYASVWRTVASQTLPKLASSHSVKGKPMSPGAYKLLLRYIGDNDPMRLARTIWMSQESRFSGRQDRSQFKFYTEGILYPD